VYNVIVANNMSTSTDDIVSDDVQLLVYPNPTSTSFTIAMATPKYDLKSIQIFNSIGQLAKQIDKSELNSKGTKHQISLANLPQGTYFIIVQTKKGQAIEQLIVL